MDKPNVLIITTGGTIASTQDSSLIAGHQLVQAVPQLLQLANIEVEEHIRIGSSKITPNHWLNLARRIKQILHERKDLTSIVITHGTDTMEETAYFLHLVHNSPVPIILTGSMRRSDDVSPDGPANLISAVRTGIDKQSVGRGVMVVMNDNIYSSRDIRKVHNTRTDAFYPGEEGFLGAVGSHEVTYYRRSSTASGAFSTLDLQTIGEFPSVDLTHDFTGYDEGLLNFFLDRPHKGLVVATFAGGRSSAAINRYLTNPSTDKIIVVTSSIPEGAITRQPNYHSSIIISKDLTPRKTRVLMILALSQTKDRASIQEIFDQF